ncbi:MAG: uridine kinase [Bryobacterales bacterium]|nr:uridine kinase [Bryobacterales bacterium]
MKIRTVGIAGPSCAGKTEVATLVARALGAPVLNLDAYYRDLAHLPPEERALWNFDTPESLDEQLLIEQIGAITRGEEAAVPVYDFAQHVRSAGVRRVQAAGYLVVEGLFALYWEPLRSLLDLKVFVSAPDAVCLDRRLERDIRERGRSRESVLEQYSRTVRPMSERFVLPTRIFADLVLDGAGSIQDSVAAVLGRLLRP